MYGEGRTAVMIQVFDKSIYDLSQGVDSMKKRCTNSACRRLFISDAVCPYCGKQYPRITARKKPIVLAEILLTDFGPSKIKTVFVLHERLEMNLLDAKRCIDTCPSIIATDIPLKEAEDLIGLFEKNRCNSMHSTYLLRIN